MATRTGLGYAATGFIVAGSIIAATAATVGLRAQQASTAPAPSTLESALVTNAAPPSALAPITAAPPAGVPVAQPAAQPVAPPPAQQFAATAAQPLTVAATSPRREHDDDEDDDDEHEEREELKRLFTSFRREHR